MRVRNRPYFPTSISVVSHHLSVLEQAGVVVSRRDGRWMRYHLANDSVLKLLGLARQLARQRKSGPRNPRRTKASEREACCEQESRRTIARKPR